MHARLTVVLPSAVTYWPALQSLQLSHAVVALASWSQLPVAHASAATDPPAQYCPATHASHTVALVALPAVVAYNIFQGRIRRTMGRVDVMAHLILTGARDEAAKEQGKGK